MKLTITYLVMLLCITFYRAQEYRFFTTNEIGLSSTITNANGMLATDNTLWVCVGNGDIASYDLASDNWYVLDESVCSQLTIDNTGMHPIYYTGDSLYFYYNWAGLHLYTKGTNLLQYIGTMPGSQNFKYYEGDFWFSVDQSSSFYKRGASSVTEFNATNSNLPDSVILNFDIDEAGNFWMYYNNHIGKFDGTNYTQYNIPFNYDHSFVRAKVLVNGDDVWFLNGHDGVVRFDRNNEIFVWYNSSNSDFPDNEIVYMAKENNKVWFLDIQHNITSFLNEDIESVNYLPFLPALPSSHLRGLGIVVDSNGNKWITTLRGVFAYNETNLSGNVAIKENKRLDFKLYPNPSKSEINIDLKGDFSDVLSMSIIDARGSVIRRSDMEKSIDMQDLKPGIYYIRIELKDQTLVKSFEKL